MNFNFRYFSARKTKNTRKSGSAFSKTQSFHGIKYQVKNNGDDKFTVSNKLWEKLGLENNALMFGTIESDVFIGVVDYDHKFATLFTKPRGEKSKTVVASNLRNDLIDSGILKNVDLKNIKKGKPDLQFIDLDQVYGKNIPEGVSAIYRVIVDESEGGKRK